MSASRYQMPARLSGADGNPRRVGIEIEMSGIELETIADQLLDKLGGTLKHISEYEIQVNDSTLGDFKVDLDFEYFQKLGRRDLDADGEWSLELEQLAADAIQALMKNLIPCELITPPLPFVRLGELDAVVEGLRECGANGTRQALFSAFGLHLNPELPDLEAATILAYLQAFVCLQVWLEEQEDIVISRKLSPFIRSYPAEYENLILAEDYAPSLAELINDYLEYNPTRNRMLDMLPMFAFLDEERVVGVVGGQKLRKRPTLHYRLPNSDVDSPKWGVWRCWNDWMQVESLANDAPRLRVVCRACLSSRASGYFSSNYHSWKDKVKQWLSAPS